MPKYDWKCAECGHTEERPFGLWVCPVCLRTLIKQPCAPNFTVKGFAASNGYSKSS